MILPDLVISYSGINDTQNNTVTNHPFITTQQNEFYTRIQKGSKSWIKRRFSNVFLDKITYGLEDKRTAAEFWYYCEKTMESICNGWGVPFYGFLQAWNEIGDQNHYSKSSIENCASFWDEAGKLIESEEHLINFSRIFDGNEDVFFDICHVYEKGNVIIMRKLLPYVLKSYKTWKENQV